MTGLVPGSAVATSPRWTAGASGNSRSGCAAGRPPCGSRSSTRTSGCPGSGARAETDEGGRGLYLVDQLATRWGSRPTQDGKAVWFEIPIKQSS